MCRSSHLVNSVQSSIGLIIFYFCCVVLRLQTDFRFVYLGVTGITDKCITTNSKIENWKICWSRLTNLRNIGFEVVLTNCK